MKNLYTIFSLTLFIVLNSFSAKAIPNSFADLVENLIPAVVSIASTTIVKNQDSQQMPKFPEGSPFDEFFKDYFENEKRKSPSRRPMVGLGSGFIIDKSGIIVTNNHVIEGADEITVIMHDQKEFKAKLLGRDPKADIAVLKIEPKNVILQQVLWGDSDKVRVGDWSIAIGNSGGPLFNVSGEVIGINSAIISQSGGSIGLGFAIPSINAQKIVNQLKEFGRTKRGWLGVQITPVSKDIAESLGLPNEKGAFISNLNPEGPSKQAGIQEGDVILKFNNSEIIKMTDLPRVVAESDIGSIAIVELWRKNKIIKIEVKLGELPEEIYVERKPLVKETTKEIVLKNLNLSIKDTQNKNGVEVIKVDIDSNLKERDIINEVNREIITDSLNFVELVNSIELTGRNSLLLKVLREGKSLWITIQFVK